MPPTPRDFPAGNFWQLIGENEARKRGLKMGNVEEMRKNGKKKDEKKGKLKKGRRKLRND